MKKHISEITGKVVGWTFTEEELANKEFNRKVNMILGRDENGYYKDPKTYEQSIHNLKLAVKELKREFNILLDGIFKREKI